MHCVNASNLMVNAFASHAENDYLSFLLFCLETIVKDDLAT